MKENKLKSLLLLQTITNFYRNTMFIFKSKNKINVFNSTFICIAISLQSCISVKNNNRITENVSHLGGSQTF